MTTRLPGIYFETLVPPVTDTLPRLDIAAFVGFAQSGPLDVPVAIKDAARFQEIFGQDQTLAWDPIAGETIYAQLPPAVRAFFRNGGQRCWAVRVADNAAATANQFMLPGTLLASPGLPEQAAWLDARSAGSWSDALELNATLGFGPIEADSPTISATGVSLVLYPNTATSVSAGDLLQVSFDLTPGSPAALVTPLLYLPVSAVKSANNIGATPAPQQSITVSSMQGYWFRQAIAEDFIPLQSSPPASQANAQTQWLHLPTSVSWLTQPASVELNIANWGVETGATPATFLLDGLRSETQDLTAGSWLRLHFEAQFLPEGAKELLLLVETVRGSAATATTGSPWMSDEETTQIVVSGAWWVLDDAVGWTYDLSAPRVDVLTLELWVRDGDGNVTTLNNLGLTPLHPRYIGYLPADHELYAQPNQPSTPPWSELIDDIDHPRFALASPTSDFAAPDATSLTPASLPFYLPLGVPGLVDQSFYQPAIAQAATALERDGLALASSQLSASLFLDPDLADSSVSTLLTEAFHKQYQLQRGQFQGPPGEPLLKMHAILPIDEISLLALPDAMHPGWQPASLITAGGLAAPVLTDIAAPSGQKQIAASIAAYWKAVSGATSYTLEESADPRFGSSATVWQGSGLPIPSDASLLRSALFDQPSGCPGLAYFRVSASQNGIAGPWSNTLARALPIEPFAWCNPAALAAPLLAMPTESRGRVLLEWSGPQADAYELQVAYKPSFVLPETLYRGPDTYFEIWSDPSRTAYFRVNATRGTMSSPWSNTAIAQSDLQYQQYWMNTPPEAGSPGSISNDLLRIQQAMIRLCAARGDAFALLGLPRSYDAATCVLHKNLLTASLVPEDGDTTLSYAAIYHPWLVALDSSDDQPGAIRSVSPEGAIAGILAALTLSSGAWFSPANQRMQGAVDLDAQLDDQAPTLFFNNQLNLCVQAPPGFLTMSSFTLSPSSQLTEINVRRLLLLLRRLALREGVDYVFQPNDTTFWRRVQRRFEELLSGLFLRGAFAGATQDESYRVRTDSSLNTPDSISQGSFIVEISVAPSLPLEFLTVRLLQKDGNLSLSEEL